MRVYELRERLEGLDDAEHVFVEVVVHNGSGDKRHTLSIDDLVEVSNNGSNYHAIETNVFPVEVIDKVG